MRRVAIVRVASIRNKKAARGGLDRPGGVDGIRAGCGGALGWYEWSIQVLLGASRFENMKIFCITWLHLLSGTRIL